MGIFSRFGKKDRQAGDMPSGEVPLRQQREESPAQAEPLPLEQTGAKKIQRKAAHATALKIDAIESEMSSEFVRPVSSNKSFSASGAFAAPAQAALEPTVALPDMQGPTAFLLGSETVDGLAIAVSASSATPAMEEAAILFANEQMDMVEQVLLTAIDADAHDHAMDDKPGSAATTVWHMLFDFYQIAGQRQLFDNLSIAYASKFETSPPSWIAPAQQQAPAVAASAIAAPVIAFSGALDAGIVKQLEKAKNLAEKCPALRMEFSRISQVDPIGCDMLLSVLKKLQKSGHDLLLTGAFELSGKIRAILKVGRRDETEAPWLLLLEILRLLNLEREFEEASIEYCITFEVSPPAFVAPQAMVATPIEELVLPHAANSAFSMPAVIADNADKIIAAITEHAASRNQAVVDCSQLTRVSFAAAGQLLSGLAPLTARGTHIELHHVNHLVAALFAVMGISDTVQVVVHKS